MFRMRDEKGLDDKVLWVPATHPPSTDPVWSKTPWDPVWA
jgi:inorganic pyrophosphatase